MTDYIYINEKQMRENRKTALGLVKREYNNVPPQ